jgi:hypothetical protein
MTAADKLLDRLDGVKRSGDQRWVAKCPAHLDKTPSLSIRAQDDGRVLIHCFALCPTINVLQAIGLDFSDLFDKPFAHHLPPIRGGWTARELLELNGHEATIAAMLAATLTPTEAARLAQAAERLEDSPEFLHLPRVPQSSWREAHLFIVRPSPDT